MTQIVKTKNKGGRPPKVSLPRLKEELEEYLADCSKGLGKTPFMVGFAQRLGIDQDTLTSYGNKPGYSDIIKRLKQATEIALLERVADTQKPVGGIFLLKAKYGYQEAATRLDIKVDTGVVQMPTNPDKVKK